MMVSVSLQCKCSVKQYLALKVLFLQVNNYKFYMLSFNTQLMAVLSNATQVVYCDCSDCGIVGSSKFEA